MPSAPNEVFDSTQSSQGRVLQTLRHVAVWCLSIAWGCICMSRQTQSRIPSELYAAVAACTSKACALPKSSSPTLHTLRDVVVKSAGTYFSNDPNKALSKCWRAVSSAAECAVAMGALPPASSGALRDAAGGLLF
eukprot:CAMPEP_0203938936 /NCGR_PEP_ID=MMETSP0359-20131031/75839_1 /ASSEMBLY_ACC=CAM_ASM_000338 /TAXON_ID=268821 /ORGANISM="Scrippsiella Hangoei, Strain SHTV-5" /LENGTH=134 /DNA_ID=CAMNT_0050869193 /DNA_START=119 /DNA_END=523 /DNA_ORIENTATION=-